MKKIENGVILTSEEYERLTRKSKTKTANVVLTILGVFLLAFITAMIVTFWKFQQVPDMLIQMTMGAGGLEALVLAAIKISKVCKEQTNATKESEG